MPGATGAPAACCRQRREWSRGFRPAWRCRREHTAFVSHAKLRRMPPQPQQVADVQRGLLDWYARHHRDLPWRHTRDPYAILVSEIMLQQTQVDRVIPKWHAWLARFPTIRALADASRADAIREWQ